MDYFEANRNLWNQKTGYHINSDFYDVAGFKNGKEILNRYELDLLGDIRGKNLLHLQCHFGMDTLALARHGALVTGTDIADAAIAQAIMLAEETDIDANFVCCNLYDLKEHLHGQFDIVFTSYGTIGWLPDLNKWASVIAHFLKPGGMFLIVDFHPLLWMFDNTFTHIKYSYLNRGVIADEEEGTYADRSAPIRQTAYGWNHGFSEIINALITHGLSISAVHEYTSSPYNCFSNTVPVAGNMFQIKGMEEKIPMVYAIKATQNP